ncbi:MAG: phage integrase SAM-like domain-containing protein [Bacteroidetes bacterium]|nr:phage integrase SAM-like domain-containing protein [Bacteroidota bacterium]
MASITFLLKDSKGDKESIIYAVIRKENERAKLSIGKNYMINPILWDKEFQRAIVKNSHKQLKEAKIKLDKVEIDHNKLINDRINNCLNHFNKIISKADYDQTTLSINYLKEEMKSFLNPNSNLKNRSMSFFEYIEYFIEQREKGEIKTKSNELYSQATIDNYNATLKHLENYCKKKKIKLNYDDITMNFYHDYKNYLFKEDLSDNTISKDIKHIKLFLRNSWNEKYHNNRIFEDRSFERPEPKQIQRIVLSEDEIDKFYNHDFSNNPKYEKVRDMFIIGCCTGLRYSDFSRIKKEHINGNYFKILTQKTKEYVTIPIMPLVKQILEKYNYNLPRQISNQKFNDFLKLAAEEAKINTKIPYPIREKGLTREKFIKKHEKISSHCARRTFATNAYLNDVPTLSIMAITGHRTEKAFLRYINVTTQQHAEKMKTHPFFNRKVIKNVG